ncbi:hypothetical protein QZH41_001220 [Actinostola sp. cb2023]|nr:hypothetical protein QZH41_001220 [Actinostola sp. cb2023]
MLVYALLDEQSDACFIKESVLNNLHISGPEVELELSTVLARKTITSRKINGLVARGFNETQDIVLPRTYTRELIPAQRDHIPRPETARKWPHLESIADHIMPLREDIDVAILIGSNCTRAIKPREIIPGQDDDPYGKRTSLGWGIVGIVARDDNDFETNHLEINQTVARVALQGQEGHCQFVLKTQVKEILDHAQMRKMFELDFSENEEVQALSHDDRMFLNKVKEGIHQLPDGHYEIPLPLRDDDLKLPNNKEQALGRLNKLKRRFNSDGKYKNDYMTFMKGLMDSNCAEKVPKEDIDMVDGHSWYLPHHGVYHPKKPQKIRVVFDCSAEYKGESLNRHLLQGPDLINNLVGVLARFRKERSAIMCDIEGMFHQVHVNEKHRNYLRFLWWEDGNLETDPTEYRMTVHLFGATSSPGCANYALKSAADDNEEEFGSEAADFVRNDFYVDDGLKSLSSSAEAIKLIEKTTSLCKKGGFRLHKFVSNDIEVIKAISPEERAVGIKELDLGRDTLPIERALGVQWCIESDTLRFKIELSNRPPTRRGILSTVSSVFDPLGVLSPLVLVGKGILQQLCRDGVNWDGEIPEPLRPKWEKWRNDLHLLQRLKIPRCYKPDDFGQVQVVELHNFSDASTVGYGQCSYLRLIDDKNNIHVSLVTAKSRVTPLKPVTIPRLELTAALVSAKVNARLQKELAYRDAKQVFWTDSKFVLGYISNNARRFHVFVANRVQQIRDLSSPEEWRYVDTKSNPADYASRGLSAEDLINKKEWWDGPEFLWAPINDQRGVIQDITILSSNDPEIKATVMATHSQERQEKESLEDRLRYFSEWHKAKRAIAVCLRWKEIIRTRRKENKENKGEEVNNHTRTTYEPVNVAEMERAKFKIVKEVQRKAFKEEIEVLRSEASSKPDFREDARNRNKAVRRTSTLYKLDPFLDEEGILRVGGRIRRANLPDHVKHPYILPKISVVTDMIIRHYHEQAAHQGRGITLNNIRSSGVWIVGGSPAVASHISKCIKCRKLRAAPENQKMADLPDDRLEPSPPFTYSAVDYFGPFMIKEGRKEVKRYGVLFTCMASRAIHLETGNSMDTSSFINAYRRFVGRRGPVRQLRSDRGSNFIGCKNELQSALKELDQEKIRQGLLEDNCDWVQFKMNVPHASHMGGSWERQIRTVRNVLASLLDSHGCQLDDESLRTLMVEAEAIVNSRPLTSDYSSSLEPLTPNHLLTLKSHVVLPPPGNFVRADLYSRKRWRRVQHLAEEFWSRWKKEFLQTLQARQKWIHPRRNLEGGDIVLLKDDDVPLNRWRLARVEETYPSQDGLVRKVKIAVADRMLDSKGKPSHPISYLDRPVQKLVFLLSPGDDDRGIPAEEPSTTELDRDDLGESSVLHI